jgi:hypothetical protein
LIPHPSSLTEPFDYPALVRHVQILAENANLPLVCLEAVERITNLGLWKQRELDRGALSYKELVRYGLVIEELLVSAYERQKAVTLASDPRSSTPSSESNGEEMLAYMNFVDDEAETHSNSSSDSWQTLADPSSNQITSKSMQDWAIKIENLDPPMADVLTLSDSSSSLITSPLHGEYPDWGYVAEQNIANNARGSLQDLSYLTTLMFLHSIVSGPQPRVPEIADVSGKVLDILVCPTIDPSIISQRLFSASLACLLSEGSQEERAKKVFFDIYTSTEVRNNIVRDSALAMMEKRISTA